MDKKTILMAILQVYLFILKMAEFPWNEHYHSTEALWPFTYKISTIYGIFPSI